jgi:ankyrin repeat protein
MKYFLLHATHHITVTNSFSKGNSAMSLTEDDIDDLLYFSRINEKDDFQQALRELSETHKITVAEIFLTARDERSGNSTLHYACANGHSGLPPCSQLNDSLLTMESDVVSLILGESPAAGPSSGSESKATSLVNLQNTAGNTPLHWAALNGHVDIIKLLLSHGADPSILNVAGHDAVFEAELNDKTAAAELLLTEGIQLETGLSNDDDEKETEDEIEEPSVTVEATSSKLDAEMEDAH